LAASQASSSSRMSLIPTAFRFALSVDDSGDSNDVAL